LYLIRQIEKLTLLITVGALFLTCLVLPIGSAGKETLDAASPQLVKRVATRNSDANDRSLIHPGKSVGPLSLGDSEDHARAIFPVKPNIDQEWPDECGTEINWVDLNNRPVGMFSSELSTPAFCKSNLQRLVIRRRKVSVSGRRLQT
jgi:hypothetical protein